MLRKYSQLFAVALIAYLFISAPTPLFAARNKTISVQVKVSERVVQCGKYFDITVTCKASGGVDDVGWVIADLGLSAQTSGNGAKRFTYTWSDVWIRKPGKYMLKVSATSGELQDSDDMKVSAVGRPIKDRTNKYYTGRKSSLISTGAPKKAPLPPNVSINFPSMRRNSKVDSSGSSNNAPAVDPNVRYGYFFDSDLEEKSSGKRKKVTGKDKYPDAPTVAITVSPEVITVNQPFEITVTGTSPLGLSSLWWCGDNTGIENLDKAYSVDGAGEKKFTHTWKGLKIGKSGNYYFWANARDVIYLSTDKKPDGKPHQASDISGVASAYIRVKPSPKEN